jgi:hypothetical protein
MGDEAGAQTRCLLVVVERIYMARKVQELKRLAIRSNECVRKRVEGEVTHEGHCSYDVRRSDEGMGGRVSLVTTSEVTVVGHDDWK